MSGLGGADGAGTGPGNPPQVVSSVLAPDGSSAAGVGGGVGNGAQNNAVAGGAVAGTTQATGGGSSRLLPIEKMQKLFQVRFRRVCNAAIDAFYGRRSPKR